MLFSGSIRDNIERGKPGASIEEIEDAAKKAFAHDFITSFTVGVAGVVGMVMGARCFSSVIPKSFILGDSRKFECLMKRAGLTR